MFKEYVTFSNQYKNTHFPQHNEKICPLNVVYIRCLPHYSVVLGYKKKIFAINELTNLCHKKLNSFFIKNYNFYLLGQYLFSLKIYPNKVIFIVHIITVLLKIYKQGQKLYIIK